MPGGSSRFELATAGRIVFGAGAVDDLGHVARELGRRALLVTGGDPERALSARRALDGEGVDVDAASFRGEPTVDIVRRAAADCRDRGCDLVVAVGGGSALDAGKAIAALATNGEDPLEYVEVIGRGRPLTRVPLPFVAVPTTAGTGAEVTRNAVLTSPEHRAKVSLRSPMMLPRVALVDPDLLEGLPRHVLAGSGMDALAQLIEPYVSLKAQPLTDALCREGMERSVRSLARACSGSMGGQEREDLALASLCGGLALANAGLGAVHGLAAPIGGMFPAPHGPVCAALLPHVMAANVRALRAREPRSPALSRFAAVARLVTGRADAAPEDGVAWCRDLCATLEIPGLGRYGMTVAHLSEVAGKGRGASSMRGNPIALGEGELTAILSDAL